MPILPPADSAIRVLVVDDERTLRSTLQVLLADASDVVLAESGAAAFAVLSEDRAFDVILCDLMMPEMTGIELYERAVAATPTVAGRFVFLTGGVFTDEARAFLDAPGRRWLTKPARRDELAAALDAVVTATAAA